MNCIGEGNTILSVAFGESGKFINRGVKPFPNQAAVGPALEEKDKEEDEEGAEIYEKVSKEVCVDDDKVLNGRRITFFRRVAMTEQ